MNYLKQYLINLDDDILPQNRGKVAEITATTLPKLERLGFEGTDMSLEISLFEYDMAWKKDGDDWHFIFKIDRDGQYDFSPLPVGADWREVCGWATPADRASFLDTLGVDEEEFDSWAFPQQVADMTRYWGWQNIFGGCCYDGFYIFKDGRCRASEYFDIINGKDSF